MRVSDAGAPRHGLPASVQRRDAAARDDRHGRSSNEPDLLIADEPTTALDVTVQAQILELLRDLNEQTGAAIMLITHNLGVVAGLCKRVLVMYAGEIVEEGTVEQIFESPAAPLHVVAAALRAAHRRQAGATDCSRIEGLPPDLIDLPPGCKFNPRCPFRIERVQRGRRPPSEVAPAQMARVLGA